MHEPVSPHCGAGLGKMWPIRIEARIIVFPFVGPSFLISVHGFERALCTVRWCF